jgi:hypothetical protein
LQQGRGERKGVGHGGYVDLPVRIR